MTLQLFKSQQVSSLLLLLPLVLSETGSLTNLSVYELLVFTGKHRVMKGLRLP